MANRLTFALIIALAGLAATLPVHAQELQFDPNANCRTVLAGNTEAAAFWAFGYVAHQLQRPRTVEADMIADFLGDFAPACNATPKASFITVLDRLIAGPQARTKITGIAIPLVELFQAPDLDLVQVIRSLKPTPNDIRAVYSEPLASGLITMYEETFGPELDEAGFPPGPFEIMPEFTTTLSLPQSQLLGELPGGYQRVLDLFLADAPFGRIVLVLPDDEDRIKLDGLTFINGHWVIMPRPWRALD